MEGTIADDLGHAVVEINDRCKREVHPDRAQFRAEQPAHLAGDIPCAVRVGIVAAAEEAHRRQHREVLAKTLDPPALVIDRDQQRRPAQGADLGDEARDLLAAVEVARKEDHRADERVLEHIAVLGQQRAAGNVDHQRTERHGTCPARSAAVQAEKGRDASRKL